MGSKNQISFVDLTILRFLWIIQSVYENIVSVFKWQFWKRSSPTAQNSKTFHEKRHFIQFYRIEPKRIGEKPICYMDVTEFDSSQEEEIRRKKAARHNHINKIFLKHNRHIRSHGDNDLQRFYCSSLRY